MSKDALSVVNRADPNSIDKTLKEAVAYALLGSIFQRLSGCSKSCSILKGEKPSRSLSTAFLLPANPDSEGVDDETSPIRITATGFDFMVRADAKGSVSVTPKFSIYVRVLPSVEELREEGISFRLTTEIDRRVRREVRTRERALWEEQKNLFNDDRNNPLWVEQRSAISKQVYEDFGVHNGSDVVGLEGSNDHVEGGDDIFEVRGFHVYPGSTIFPSTDVVRLERPIEKWLCIPIVCAPLEFCLDEESSVDLAVSQSNLEIQFAINAALDNWLQLNEPETGGMFWAYPKQRKFSPIEIANWQSTLDQIQVEMAAKSIADRRIEVALPEQRIEWAVAIRPDWSDSTRRAVHVALENRSALPQRGVSETEESIFQVELRCYVPHSSHSSMRLDRVKSSYRFNRYLYYAALGFNCGVRNYMEADNVVLETDWMPKYALPKIEPTTHGVDCTFKSLADSKQSVGAVSEIASEFISWVSKLEIDVTDGLYDSEFEEAENEKHQYAEDRSAWNREAGMIQRGTDMLRHSSQYDVGDDRSIPFRAWLLMNETMRRMAAGRFDSWRLFQLAFILATLPSLVTRMPQFAEEYDSEVDDATTLLYFATGGGKSEAFFGLLVFGLFFDRLRGKLLGVTAMIRYPLRLLTVQQAQRASRVLARAEVVRQENNIDGEPFSIGFWVGSSNTPNYHRAPGVSDIPFIDNVDQTEDELRRSSRKYRQSISDWLKLPTCPFCGGATGLRRTRPEGHALSNGVVGHFCTGSQCEWNDMNGDCRPLPFYIVDEDIYSIAPSVLLGTVDKLALIGQSPGTISRVIGMFGFSAWQDSLSGRFITPNPRQYLDEPDNVIRLSPVYHTGINIFVDPFPSLLIQDEAHLLEESLGTFAGLFETTLFEVYRRLSQHNISVAVAPNGSIRMPKIVAASATVSDPERQVENLYQRKLIQFPYPGPQLYESFYAMPEMSDTNDHEKNTADIEEIAHLRRIYATILTNGKPHTTASVYVLSAFHCLITNLIVSLVEGDQERKNICRRQLSEAVLISSDRRSYSGVIESAAIEHIATLIDLHRIALTYVTNKKGGDQILAAESEQVRKDHIRESLPNKNFERRLITGSVDAGLIQQVIEDAERRPLPGQPFDDLDSSLRSIVATSAISHGVDVEELNSMFFAGMPSDIAEYIQASSRVGRTHVGFSLLLPVPQRKRDRYIVETHDIFHRFLERMIQPPAIDRWAEKALVRVVPSFFQTYLISVLAIDGLIRAEDAHKNRAPSFGRISDVRNAAGDPVAFREGLVNFIVKAVGLNSSYGPPNIEFYKELLQDRVRRLLDDTSEPDMINLTIRDFFDELAKRSPETLEKPMTSLRDVDVPGYLVPAPDHTGQGGRSRAHLNDEQLAELMRFLRKGGSGVVGRDGA